MKSGTSGRKLLKHKMNRSRWAGEVASPVFSFFQKVGESRMGTGIFNATKKKNKAVVITESHFFYNGDTATAKQSTILEN